MDPKTAYRAIEVQGSRPVQLIALLYEQMIEDLRQAVNAIEQGNIELRTHRINHAILVLGYLQSQLNMQAGGEVARDLERFYQHVRSNLVEGQSLVSREILAGQITDLLTVREAWIEVDRAEVTRAAESTWHVDATEKV